MWEIVALRHRGLRANVCEQLQHPIRQHITGRAGLYRSLAVAENAMSAKGFMAATSSGPSSRHFNRAAEPPAPAGPSGEEKDCNYADREEQIRRATVANEALLSLLNPKWPWRPGVAPAGCFRFVDTPMDSATSCSTSRVGGSACGGGLIDIDAPQGACPHHQGACSSDMPPAPTKRYRLPAASARQSRSAQVQRRFSSCFPSPSSLV